MSRDDAKSIKGSDIRQNLWLPESAANCGARKALRIDNENKIEVVIPARSHNGLVIRLRGLGSKPAFTWRHPFLRRERGNLLVRLFVYPDDISPAYGSFDRLSTDDMALEGWVYRKIDAITGKLGTSFFAHDPIAAHSVADLYNEYGWRAIFKALVRHLSLTDLDLRLTASDSLPHPGSCQRSVTVGDPKGSVSRYEVTIRDHFLDNPFTVAAILAHELCHAVYYERVEGQLGSVRYGQGSLRPSMFGEMSKEDLLEMERTVDLLVFMFGIGEFQLRTSRDSRLTLGYFNQGIFERIQVIASRRRSQF